MTNYYYCPILKTRPAEIQAYELLDDAIKDSILPIIEMTGALSYTYPRTYKVPSLRHTKRAGDIYTKIKKIKDLMQNRRFILDITDDESLMFDGLSEAKGGLLDHTNGYEKWLSFLTSDKDFTTLLIPTIQFNTLYREDVERQINKLDEQFDHIAIKLPAFFAPNGALVFNFLIPDIIQWISKHTKIEKLIVIIDFGYTKSLEEDLALTRKGISSLRAIQKVFAIIPVSSSFPNFVTNVPRPICITENRISHFMQDFFQEATCVHGDYSSLHPVKYGMKGGGWVPRIDYIVYDDSYSPMLYDYVRGKKKNLSSEYVSLARGVLERSNYVPISRIDTEGDQRINAKARGGIEGKAPAYWISTRSNLFMTAQALYHKDRGIFLSL